MMRIKSNFILYLILTFLVFNSCIEDKEKAEIEYISGTYDFGTINMQDTIFHTFLLKNVANNDLRISDFNASCGCTTMKITDSIIKPSDTAKISVRFLPDKIGASEKIIVMEANTDPPFTILRLLGNIE